MSNMFKRLQAEDIDYSGGLRFSWSLRQLPKLVKLQHALRLALHRQNLDAENPGFVLLTDSAVEVLARARMLASDDRDDAAAVSELVGLARGDHQTLRLAALGARQNNEHRESYADNLTHRLLQAAASGAPVAPVSDSERDQLALFEEFSSLTMSAQWDELTQIEPRLSELTAHAPDVRLARHVKAREVAEVSAPLRREIVAARQRTRRELTPLIGPKSQAAHALLRSQLAFDAALTHLMELHAND